MSLRSTYYRTALFADISDSTRLYEILGGSEAREIIAQCLSQMSAIACAHNGNVIKTIGDEVLCTFADADTAARAAVEMQERISSITHSKDGQMSLHIGFHYGEIIKDEEDGDIYGDTVNVASRMVSQAKARQIVTTRETFNLLNKNIQSKTRLVDHTRVKGKALAMEIYELVWGELEDMTMIDEINLSHRPFQQQGHRMALRLVHQGQTFCMNDTDPSLTLGRSWENRIVIQNKKVSRLHAKIELRRDKFILIDQSTNGTYVYPQDGERVIVHRDEFPLEGKGYIGLSNSLKPNSPLAIYYEFNR